MNTDKTVVLPNLIMMKPSLCSLLIFLFFPFSLHAQYAGGKIDYQFLESMLKGEANSFYSMMDRDTQYQKDATFIMHSPKQIVFQLQHFFKYHPCACLKVIYDGVSEDFSFAQIDYWTLDGQSFSFILFFDNQKLSKIRIDRKGT